MTSLLNEDATVATMETVMKNIYTSCDPENSNLVPVSKIIDFITPYMLEDLSALENLRSFLDPQNSNVCISSEQFYEIMNEWTKTIASSADEDNDFNRTPSQLDVIDEKQLPYTQSTPRASFGQKLLSCEGLLNLSNVSSYSLSTSTQTGENSTAVSLVGPERTILEEEIKRLEHHLSKLSNEMVMVRLQLTSTEEQNEMLQADLDRCRTRLHSEQQMIEHLQNDKRYNDELREELNANKKQIEELIKKLLQSEKDNNHLYGIIEQTEKENLNLENRCEELSRREQEAKKEIIDIKTELDLKDQEITTIIKINDEMKIKLNQQKDLIDQLTNENELLNHKKISLEKVLRENLSARRDSIVSQYKTCLADSSSFPNLDQSSEEECYFKIQEADSKSFILCESLRAEISQVSFGKDKQRYSDNFPLECDENPIPILDNNQNLNDNLAIYEQEINQLKAEDNNIRTKLSVINNDNEQLQAELLEMKNKVSTLQQDIDNLAAEKTEKEECLKQIENEKCELEIELEALKETNSLLQDENNNLMGNNKSLNDTLELKNKLLTDLNEGLLALKQEIANLQSDNISKENELYELRNKFDFEVAFKKLQTELNERNIEVSELNKSNEELRETLNKLTNSNQVLQKSLKETKLRLEEHEEKSKQMLMLNENIEHTTSQVQLCIDEKNSVISELQELNKKFEGNISMLQDELQTKFQEIMDLRDCLKKDMDIKNIMWRDNKDLSLKLKVQSDANMILNEELVAVRDKIKTIDDDYKNLMAAYNEETDNTKQLAEQLSIEKEKFIKEVETLKAKQSKRDEEFRTKLIHYETTTRNFEKVTKELETERKKSKQEKFFDIDITPSESGKNRSFEKQKLSIDRLKEKLEYATLELRNERHICEQLRKEILAKNQLEEKYANMQLEFENKQVKSILEQQALQNIISNLSDKLKAQEDEYKKLEQLSNEKENILSSKLSQLEQQNNHLFAELRSKDFLINNIVLENEANKNFLANADRKSQECSTRLSSCILQINERDKRIQLLHSQITEKDNRVISLMSQVAELDVQLSKVHKELSEKSSTIINLQNENKSLQEMLSKSDDHKEKELMDIEHKLKATCRLLQCSEMELSLIQKKVSDAKLEFEVDAKDASEHREIIFRARSDLSRVSDFALKKWEEDLEEETYQHLLKLRKQETGEEGDGLLLLNNEIKFTVLLVETLANKAPKSMEDTDCSMNSLINTENNLAADTKTRKKFTLRPPRLIVSRPASPDSPSVDIDDVTKVDDLNTSHKYIRQDAVTGNNEDSFRTASDELSFSQGHFELVTEDGFPSISDAFLEKLGLHEYSPKQTLSKEETERLFTTFAIQIALDSKDIKDRLHNQKEQCAEEYEKFLTMLREVSARLREHKCIGATDSINAVFVLLEDLKFFAKDIMMSLGQYGILTCENRMMKCWNLVTNYMALLKQEVIKSEICRAVENQNNERGDDSNKNLRKHSKNLNKVQKRSEKSLATSKPDNKSRWSRFKDILMGRITVTVVLFLIFFILMLVIMVHWQCRMSFSENQVCVLDDFIKKIQVGHPPY